MWIRSWALLALALSALWATPSFSQTYPSKGLRLLVSASAGGGADTFVRSVGAQLGAQLKQTVAVENKPISGAQMAAAEVAKAPADGYTLLAADNGTLVMNPAVYKKLPYDVSGFAPISVMARAPLVLVASKDSGYKTAKEMIDDAKANPAKLAYASPGTGSPFHLAMEMFKAKSGLTIARVPFGGDVAALKDVLAGSLALTVIDLPSALPHLRAGKLQALAVFSSRKLAGIPDVPTLAELGYRDADAYLWKALMVPVNTPPDTQAKISQSIVAAMSNANLKRTLQESGWEILASDAGLIGALVATDAIVWHRFIKEAKISAD